MPKTGNDLRLLMLDGRSQHEDLLHTAFNEINGEISPDGRWLAYQSNESGRDEVYVRPFPQVEGGHWQVSSGGGGRPLWARNGRELFYLDGSESLWTVPVQAPTATFSVGQPTKVFEGRHCCSSLSYPGRPYDVSPDGQRFLMIKGNATGDQNSTPASLVVVLNWQAALAARERR